MGSQLLLRYAVLCHAKFQYCTHMFFQALPHKRPPYHTMISRTFLLDLCCCQCFVDASMYGLWIQDARHKQTILLFFLERKKMTCLRLRIKKIVYMRASLPRNNIQIRELCMFISVGRLRYMVVLGRLKHCPAYVLFCE